MTQTPGCALDEQTKAAILTMIESMSEEYESVEVDGVDVPIDELRAIIEGCGNPQVGNGKKVKKRESGDKKAAGAHSLFWGGCMKGGSRTAKECWDKYHTAKEKGIGTWEEFQKISP